MSSNQTHPALRMQEIIRMILVNTPDPTDICYALVCSTWCDVALDFVWRRVLDAKRIFSRLAPLQLNKATSKWMFKRPILNTDWSSFEKYRYRVRDLRIPSGDIDPSVYTSALARPSSTRLLPNLRKLYCGANPAELDLFLGESVSELQIIHSSGAKGDMGLNLCLQKIPVQSAYLTSLCLVCTSLPGDASGQIRAVFETVAMLVSLKGLSVPSMSLTPWSMGVLSSMPSLEVLEATHPPAEDVDRLMSQVKPGGFPSLKRLALATSVEQATACLTKDVAPNLSDISIVAHYQGHAIACNTFLSVISLLDIVSEQLTIRDIVEVDIVSEQLTIRDIPGSSELGGK
ncbi:hypothetical protein ONZ45_g9366 [Pleurotus djamor]|nr:hypothetical protein ONZ45_g9366 [Pleurotus djamor]